MRQSPLLPSNYYDDKTGDKYGSFTIVRFSHYQSKHSYWVHRCECGNEKVMCISYRNHKKITDCGCKTQRKKWSRRSRVTNVRVEGLDSDRKYILKLLGRMKDRCYNKKSDSYKWYGARGIKICDAWLSDSDKFYTWAKANGFSKGLLIDRIDVNGNYTPDNCRFVDDKTSGRNTRRTMYVTLFGCEKPFIEWCELFDIKYGHTYQTYIYKQGLSPTETLKKVILFPQRVFFLTDDAYLHAVENIELLSDTILDNIKHVAV